MKKNIMAIAVLLAVACNNKIVPSDTAYQNREIINEKGATILIGRTAPYMLQQGNYKEWFDKNYSSYPTDSNGVQQLKPLLANKTIEIFLGSWCGDSKREVPRMLKILQQAGFDTAQLRLVFVDYTLGAYKQSPQHEEKEKNVHRVPTFIIYEGKKELGRIVESPVVSLEKDLLSILQKQPYTSNYRAILQWQQQVKQKDKLKTAEDMQAIATLLKPACTSWGEFNAYGYMLYSSKRINEAGNVFRLNTILFPDKPGAHSSLGEYYFLTGDRGASKNCYLKVLELKPDDTYAKKKLEEL